jgi:hypothetical protein
MGEPPGSEEYVWRFKLAEETDEPLHADALTEMVRRQLRALLGCVILTERGSELKVTGFRFLDGDEEHAVWGPPED